MTSKALTASRRPGRSRASFQRKRDEIIRVATRLFAEQGFHATSITHICDAAGVGRGVLYHYVSSKEEVLFAIHERFIEPLLAQSREITSSDEPPDVILSNLSRYLMNTVADYLDEVTVFLHEWRSLAATDTRWEEVRRKRREFERIIQETIEEGQRVGLFRDLDARVAALAFLDMHNYAYQWLRPIGRLTPTDISDHFSDIFLNGLKQLNTAHQKDGTS